MEFAQMSAELRHGSGKGACRKIRHKGFIPAVFYGPETRPLSLTVDPKDIGKIFSSPGGVNTLIELTIVDPHENGELQKIAILKDWQIHPVKRTLLHADLYEVNVSRPIVVDVPLHFVGVPKAAAFGGILEEVKREISVECLPTMIPDFIEVDVSQLDFGDSIHVRELHVGEEITVVDDPEITVVTVMAPKAEEEKVAPEAEEMPAVEVVKQKPSEDTEK